MKEVSFSIDAKQLKALFDKLDSLKKGILIKRSLDQSAKYLIGWIKKNRLTGPKPRYLGVDTGRLRSSISSSKSEKTAEGFVVRIGTNVDYAEAHEFGFQGRVTVSAHIRTQRKKVKLFGKTKKIRSGDSHVRTHSRQMNIKARPFMRPSIESETNRAKILSIFTSNISKELEKK